MSQPADAAPPYCYRHPDRETYIKCQRCGRPICPDCMRQASVGFQCPECVAEGARSVRQSRTVAGGLAPAQVGIVSYVLIGINVVAFLAQLVTGGNDGTVTHWGAMLTESAWARENGEVVELTGVEDGGWWRIVTSGFLHFGFIHIMFNMYALYLFGPMLERMLGYVRFIAMYMTSLVAGSLFVYLFADPRTLTAGASGAIFGLLGCTLVLFLKHGYDVRVLLGLLAINAFITFAFGGISWQAHLGGFVAGVLCGGALGFAPRQGRTYVQVAAFAVLWIAIAAGFVLRTGQLTA
ncbi:rhomboid family intramembrane serine protease [Solicola gregarius]|uniref:Rhomboid family intramembrane serine protease n=1 Tax=Solicola gregarius TaxID=2908642 RepID=A0AA46YM70_9ACTN|nr:rhomboid family intramembrane serine protease [Solicola gregarius]UYM07407.1 rhomboid family intramembrane serine protease [Solicola gregarius]